MFSVNQHIDDVYQVPAHWIFENYLVLPEQLTGKGVKIHSLFNPNDRTPSMHLYYHTKSGTYRYKCFSTGKGGSAVDLMMHLWGLSFVDASRRIISDYLEFQQNGKTVKPIALCDVPQWKVASYQPRHWQKQDAAFWSAFNISSELLHHYNVRPIDRYEMKAALASGEHVHSFDVVSKHIYGYFTKDGVLAKIYQPKNPNQKFIKVQDYVQGSDQLRGHNTLILASSLKDCMTISSMNLKVDVLAPDSENSIFSEQYIETLRERYKYIIVVFDSDTAGVKSMQEYRDRFGFPFCYIPLEKDISDVVKVHGLFRGMQELVPRLHDAMDAYPKTKMIC